MAILLIIAVSSVAASQRFAGFPAIIAVSSALLLSSSVANFQQSS
jgi:branched-subunit amino acid transport protein AzlD